MSGKGKVLLIEGSDCSFKETNAAILHHNLVSLGYNVRKYHFPNYESPSASLVKMYLKGELGENAEDIGPYVASQFYAVDRIASYITEWKEFYLSGGIIVLDRYVESNAIHQGAKFFDKKEKDEFLDWLHNLEYNINRLPKPDITFFMDMPTKIAQVIMQSRGNKVSDGKLDIHEKDKDFMKRSYENAKYISQKFNWTTISCVEDGKKFMHGIDPMSILKSREDIANEILQKTLKIL